MGGQDKGDGQEEGWPAYNLESVYQGNWCCYADDTTLTTTDDKVAELSAKLTEKYKAIAEFMVDNRLKLNDEKTHLLVMSTGQAHTRNKDKYQVVINTPTAVIKPSKSEKIFGCWV